MKTKKNEHLGISTAWYSGRLKDGHELLDRMAESGLNSLEIDYRVSEAMLLQMWPRLRRGEFSALTVHNYSPIPPGYEGSDNIASLFNPASLDEDERALAVKYSLKSIQVAAELGARLVVFHLGSVDMSCEMRRFFRHYEQQDLASPDLVSYLQDVQRTRSQLIDRHWSQLLRTLNALHQEAFQWGILIGVENRYRLSQIPFGDEFAAIFTEFQGGQFRYWHDVGHAEIYHRLGIYDHERDYLQRFQGHLAGMHIHDISGIKDHLAPGMGDFDFAMLKKYLKPDSLRILEVHHHAGTKDVVHGIDVLRHNGLI